MLDSHRGRQLGADDMQVSYQAGRYAAVAATLTYLISAALFICAFVVEDPTYDRHFSYDEYKRLNVTVLEKIWKHRHKVRERKNRPGINRPNLSLSLLTCTTSFAIYGSSLNSSALRLKINRFTLPIVSFLSALPPFFHFMPFYHAVMFFNA